MILPPVFLKRRKSLQVAFKANPSSFGLFT
jgi:hypothetical protein